MCATKSAIVFKGMSVYCPWDTDSHARMLKDRGIRDDNPFPSFVKVEIYPEDKELFERDYRKWNLHEDQDYIPDWYDHERAEALLREEVKEWHENRFLFEGQTRREITEGTWYMRGGTIEDLRGGTLRHMWGGTVEDMNGGTLRHMWGGTVEDMNGGTLRHMRGGTIESMNSGRLGSLWGGTIERV